MAQKLMLRRTPAMAAQVAKSPTAAALRKQRNAEPYVYYDTKIISAVQQNGEAAAFNFAQVINPMSFFSGRSESLNGLEITNAEDNNKLGSDFLCQCISIDVHCDADTVGLTPGTATGVAVAPAFVEAVSEFGIFALYFGTIRKLAAPVAKFPAGGGAFHQAKARTQSAAANTESGYASNGWPTRQARALLPEPILFRQGQAIRCELRFPTTALARINALAPLAGSFSACIRVNLEGIRGSQLMPGTPLG